MRLAQGRRRPLLLTGLSGLISAVLTLLAAQLPDEDYLQGAQTDLIAGLRAWIFHPAVPVDPPVVVIGLDQRSLDDPMLAPWPRPMFTPVWAMLADKAYAHGAQAIALDFILAYDAGELVKAGLDEMRNYDRGFLRLLHQEGRAGRFYTGRSAGVMPARRFIATGTPEALGLVEVPLGPGNVAREVPAVLVAADGTVLPTLSGRVRAAMGDSGGVTVPLVPPWRLDSLPVMSLIDVLTCEDDAALDRLFRGRAIFVGSTLTGEDRLRGADRLIPPLPVASGDYAPCDFPRPVVRDTDDDSLPGVFLHAAAVDAVLSGWAPRPLSAAVVTATVAAMTLAAALAALFLRLRLGFLIALAMVFAVPLAGALLLQSGWLLPSSDPLWATAAAFTIAASLRLGLVDRQARVLRSRFEQYLSPVIIARMIDENSLPEMGGETRDVTVMFADLSGFTELSSRVDSQRLMTVLNRYLDLMAKEIRDSGGYVDKFIGDAVLAMWNAPASMADHAGIAVRAGLALHRAIEAAATEMAREGIPRFGVKVGINSGPAAVGNIGARNRRNYSVIGETVNVAARLESLPGVFRTPVIIGPGTVERLGPGWCLLTVARVQLKGMAAPLPVTAALAAPGEPAPDPAGPAAYAAALADFERGAFAGASAAWQALAAQDWPGAGPAAVMAGFAARLAEAPPAEWDGGVDPGGK